MLPITTAKPDEWVAAFEHALALVPEIDRAARVAQCVSLLQSGVFDPQGIFVTREGGRVRAQVCVPLAGAACLFWLPTTSGPVAEALVQAGLDWCRTRGCKIAQAQAGANEMGRADALIRRGFRAIARLCHMERSLDDLPAKVARDLCIVHFEPAIAREFAATLERTYQDTLDCPELNGRRTIVEILEGHQGQGRFDPHFWWLAYVNNQPAGVAMLAEMPDGLTWELAYLGIVPEFRRHGIGRAMTVHALHALRATSAMRLTLIVDIRNQPARHLYESLGFVATETSTALLHFLD
ncbi:MAG TPA: GNAT family N-acetyltransferase [Gemmataceae bacterium]|nr:GNAT family N-acetyltransferase [Gemmataceae bacterium]